MNWYWVTHHLNSLLKPLGLKLHWFPNSKNIYDQDGLLSIHNHDFMLDDSFKQAYARGVKGTGIDYHWQWRVHVGLWAGHCASKLKGDFIECGVNRGFLSAALMQYLDWDSLNKTFYLLDTFQGIDERYVSEIEKEKGILSDNQKRLESNFYVKGRETAQANLSQWKNIRIIEGVIPHTLALVEAEHIAYLHLDLNCSPPEVAAIDYFWDKLVWGGFVLMDDYAYFGHNAQKSPLDNFAKSKATTIVSLPTGQGLLIKL